MLEQRSMSLNYRASWWKGDAAREENCCLELTMTGPSAKKSFRTHRADGREGHT